MLKDLPRLSLSNSERSLIKLLHKKEKTSDEDLLEFAAIQTLLNGGIVYMVEPEKMPESDPLAAVFRY